MEYGDLEEAFMFVSQGDFAAHTAMVCRSTGALCWRTEDGTIDEIPEYAGLSADWIAVPNLQEIGCGRDLVSEFVTQRLPQDATAVHGLFRRRGAYARYKHLLAQRGLLQEWYDFEEMRREQAIRQWCTDNGIQIAG